MRSKNRLLEWKNVALDEKESASRHEAAYQGLSEMKDLREVIDTASAEMGRFKAHKDEEDEKN